MRSSVFRTAGSQDRFQKSWGSLNWLISSETISSVRPDRMMSVLPAFRIRAAKLTKEWCNHQRLAAPGMS